jgi:hypothetical protein
MRKDTTSERIKRLERSLQKAEKNLANYARELGSLPGRYGYSSPEKFCAEVLHAIKYVLPALSVGRKKRHRLSPTRKAKLIKELKMSRQTNTKVAAKYGISVQTLYVIKRGAGMTKPNKKRKK